MAISRINPQEWIKREINRQFNKAVSNALGKFHQELIGCVDGWKDLGQNKGVDLVCEEKKLLLRLKISTTLKKVIKNMIHIED